MCRREHVRDPKIRPAHPAHRVRLHTRDPPAQHAHALLSNREIINHFEIMPCRFASALWQF